MTNHTPRRNPLHVRPVYLVLLALAALFSFSIYHIGAIRSDLIAYRVRSQLEPQMTQKNFSWGSPVFIRIFKEEKTFELWMQNGSDYKLLATYPVCSYSGKLGPKLSEGDRQAPEGFYAVSPGAMNTNSAFHLAFNIGFPNAYDRAHGRTGKFLMIHGGCVSAGCYAMTDENIDVIFTLMQAAFAAQQTEIPVHIFPFRLTGKNMALHGASPWRKWWAELEPAYDAFETTHHVPKIAVKDGKYHLESVP